MKKFFYLSAAAAVSLFAASCSGNKSADEAKDSDSVILTDSVAEVANPQDTVIIAEPTEDSIAPAPAEEKAQTEANPNSEKIDKLLKKYKGYVADIRDACYIDGQFCYGSILNELAPPAQKLNKELKALEGDMTPDQKAKFNKLSKSIKEVL